MRARNFFLAVLSVLLLLGIDAGIDAGFHGTGLICNKCHTIHFSEAGEVPSIENGAPVDADPRGPFKHLLVKYINELCLTCHDGVSGTPDVLTGDFNDSPERPERAAGFFEAPGVNSPNGHNLAFEQDDLTNRVVSCSTCHTMHGFSIDTMLVCVDCHDPHGRDIDYSYNSGYTYRNIRSGHSDDQPVMRAYANPDPGLELLDGYQQKNVRYTSPDSGVDDWREVTNLCSGCHRGFVGNNNTRQPANPSGVCIRHPDTDSELDVWENLNSASIDLVHWGTGEGIGFSIGRLPFMVQGATDYAGASVVEPENQVFCLTCHKAHGSDYKNAIRWPYAEDGSNLGCQQCHNKGS